VAGAHPREPADLTVVDHHVEFAVGAGHEEPGGEALGADLGGCPVTEPDEGRLVHLDPRLLTGLAHRRPPGGFDAVGVAGPSIVGVDAPAREHPHAAGELEPRVAPQEQDLDAVGAVAQQDHRGCRDQLGHRCGPLR
jgi:hypothetical protein